MNSSLKAGAVSLGMLVLAAGCASATARGTSSGSELMPSPTGTGPGARALADHRGDVTGHNGSTHTTELNRRLASLPAVADETESLPLGVGDLVEVSVFDVPELSGIKLRIPNSGSVTLPLLGAVQAVGLTATGLESVIRGQLTAKYMHNPHVTVFVSEHKSQRVSVVGAVRQGGVFALTTRLRLADALALAGGLSEEAGSIVYLIRQVRPDLDGAKPDRGQLASGRIEQAMTVIDLGDLAAGRDELNLRLQAGDVIEVPRAGSVYVGGEVNKPGSLPLKAKTRLEQALVAAGGARDVADRDDVRLYRTRPDGTREVAHFRMDDLEAGTSGPELQPDDVILVGKSTAKAVLYGIRDFLRLGIGMSLF